MVGVVVGALCLLCMVACRVLSAAVVLQGVPAFLHSLILPTFPAALAAACVGFSFGWLSCEQQHNCGLLVGWAVLMWVAVRAF